MKNAITKQDKTSIVSVMPWGKEASTETKLDHLDRVARECGTISIKAALMAGWLLTVEKASRQGTFVAWVNNNLNFSQRTAYHYMSLFEHTVALQAKNGFSLECSDKNREEMVEEYARNVESKSLTELYVEAGIVKKTKSNLGGRREGAGRKPKAETVAAAAEAIEQAVELNKVSLEQALSTIFQIVKIEDALGEIDDKFLVAFVGTLDAVHARAHEILDARKAR